MEKRAVFEAFESLLKEELDLMVRAALHARESAISDEVKSQDKYDTQSIEASYLAGAQAKRSEDLRLALGLFQKLSATISEKSEVVVEGSLVVVENLEKSTKHCFMILPKEGGQKVEVAGRRIFSLSSSSPLGAELIGRKSGEDFEFESDGKEYQYSVLELY